MANPYGHFDDEAREYVVTRPDTPLPWLNYLGQDELFGLCTNTGGGYTFWRDARLRRLTRYRYNDAPYDPVGRYLYVRDGTTVWNPAWKPTKTPLDRYECRHGLGYTRTHNEPWVVAWVGYGWGEHAPGRASPADALAAAHHVLLSHGLACERIRSASRGSRVGISLNLTDAVPASESPGDVAAAWALDGEQNRWFLDPLFRGEYPADVWERFAAVAPPVRDGDLATIAAPLDFLGVNYYSRTVVERSGVDGRRTVPQTDAPHTDMGWEIAPESLYRVLVRLRDDYAPAAVTITENGAAFADERASGGSVDDPRRSEYLAGHLEAVSRALAACVPVSGYFVWSLLDNFEWTYGYSKRFGLVYVDFETQERVPKSSFRWYRDVVAAGRAVP